MVSVHEFYLHSARGASQCQHAKPAAHVLGHLYQNINAVAVPQMDDVAGLVPDVLHPNIAGAGDRIDRLQGVDTVSLPRFGHGCPDVTKLAKGVR